MIKYRMQMLNKIWIFNFRGMIGLLTQEYKKNQTVKKFFSNGNNLTIRCSKDIQLTIFDIAVLHALHSIYVENDGIIRFLPLHIFKILTGNNKAHFCKNKIKNKTVNEMDIRISIKKLCTIDILKINDEELDVSKLLSIKETGEYFEFKCKPVFLYIIEKNMLDVARLHDFPIKIMQMNNENTKNRIHQTIDVITFKIYIIHNILNFEEVTIVNKKLKECLGLNNQIKMNSQKYKENLISYDLFRRNHNKINRKFRLNVTNFLNLLKFLNIIKEFKIYKDVTIIYQ